MKSRLREKTTTVSFRVPESKVQVLKVLVFGIIREWQRLNKSETAIEVEVEEEEKPKFYGEFFPND